GLKHLESGFSANPVGLAEEIWKASERESLEASIEAAFEAIRSRRTESYVVPSYCDNLRVCERVCFSYFLNIQKEELGFDHQEVAMPYMPPLDK
ncbi:hypothetical protein S83_063051, partial [Arachis hypogaea]